MSEVIVRGQQRRLYPDRTNATRFNQWGLISGVEGASRHLRTAHKRRPRAQRALWRRRKGSARSRSQARKLGVIHRKVRDRGKDLLHSVSHSLTAKSDVLRAETLNVPGTARNHPIALSVADAGMSRLVTFCAYKADWRGRVVVRIDRWFPGSQSCCRCGERHGELKSLSRDTMRCACGNVMGRERNAAVNHYAYVTRGARDRSDPPRATRKVTADQGSSATGRLESHIDIHSSAL